MKVCKRLRVKSYKYTHDHDIHHDSEHEIHHDVYI